MDDIADVDAAAWGQLGTHLAWQLAYLRITAADPSALLRFSVLHRDGRPVAGAMRTWLEGPGWGFTDPVELLSGDGVSFDYPVTVYALPAAHLPGIGAAETATVADVSALLADLERSDAAKGATLTAVLTVPPGREVLTAALRQRGYIPFETATECVLEVDDGGLEGYLATVPGHRRRTLRHEIRRFDESGLTVAERPVAGIGREHARLIVLHLRKYGRDDESEDAMADRLRAILGNVGESCVLLEARREGELAGFVIAYRDGSDLYPRVLGIDHGLTAGTFTYFMLGYYALVRHAGRTGARRILFGPSAYGAKALRGCRPERRVSWVLPLTGDGDLVRQRAAAVTSAHVAVLEAQPWLPDPTAEAAGA